MGAYVKLLEYDNIDGMILLSELSRRRIRSIQKLIRIGRNEVVIVLRVDKEKGTLATISSCEGRAQLADSWVLHRLHRSFQASCLSRGCDQVRGAVQQEQGGALHHAPRRRGDSDSPRGPLPADRLALEPEIRPLPRCFQDFYHVRAAIFCPGL
jgi:hypothetical protein